MYSLKKDITFLYYTKAFKGKKRNKFWDILHNKGFLLFVETLKSLYRQAAIQGDKGFKRNSTTLGNSN